MPRPAPNPSTLCGSPSKNRPPRQGVAQVGGEMRHPRDPARGPFFVARRSRHEVPKTPGALYYRTGRTSRTAQRTLSPGKSTRLPIPEMRSCTPCGCPLHSHVVEGRSPEDPWISRRIHPRPLGVAEIDGEVQRPIGVKGIERLCSPGFVGATPLDPGKLTDPSSLDPARGRS